MSLESGKFAAILVWYLYFFHVLKIIYAETQNGNFSELCDD